MIPTLRLKPGRDASIRAGHPWIFSRALDGDEGLKLEPGSLVKIEDDQKRPVGLGYVNPLTSIRVRMLSLDANTTIDAAFFAAQFLKLDTWKRERLPADTNGYRVVHAEADGIPGLILDRFADVFVFQLHTAGIERFRAEIIAAIEHAYTPDAIIERSDLDVRRIEGLKDGPVTVHKGEIAGTVTFKEAGLTFFADVLKGQKTGFFLDQREARLAVQRLAKGKRVLNLFGYSGAFSVHAMKGGASFVSTVDVSRPALELAEKNTNANGFNADDAATCAFLKADVMDMLGGKTIPDGPFGLIVCDPPAFAKSERHLPQAIQAYTDLNQACLENLDVGGILVSSSCSGRVSPEEFRSMLRIAAGHAKRDVRVLEFLTQPIDHAERLAYPEGRYLKTAILEVTAKL